MSWCPWLKSGWNKNSLWSSFLSNCLTLKHPRNSSGTCSACFKLLILFFFTLSLSPLSAYCHQVVPLLVSRCDEATLESLSSDVLGTSLHDLLKENLPACLVLILTSYTEQGSGGEGKEGGGGAREKEKQLASNSHNLLTKILSEEVIT